MFKLVIRNRKIIMLVLFCFILVGCTADIKSEKEKHTLIPMECQWQEGKHENGRLLSSNEQEENSGLSTYEYTYDAVGNRRQAVYDGDGNRAFQLNYNLHTDEDWKDNSGYGNADNAEEHNSQNQSGILLPVKLPDGGQLPRRYQKSADAERR